MDKSFVKALKDKIIKPTLNSNFLSLFKVHDESYRLTDKYNDPLNYVFFYHLGKVIKPESLLEFGLDMGIASGCFILGAGSVNYFCSIQKGKKLKLAISNIHNCLKKRFVCYSGDITNKIFLDKFKNHKYDCVIINESDVDLTPRMNLGWNNLKSGIMVVNYLKNQEVKKCVDNFCKIKNREVIILNTRYGIGLIER